MKNYMEAIDQACALDDEVSDLNAQIDTLLAQRNSKRAAANAANTRAQNHPERAEFLRDPTTYRIKHSKLNLT